MDDTRISEAHAMVSLRGRELRLLALRGVVALEGQPLRELVLEPGQTLLVAPDLGLEVEEVVLPEHVLGIEGGGWRDRSSPARTRCGCGRVPRSRGAIAPARTRGSTTPARAGA